MRKKTKKISAGFTLIEVLVVVFVVGIGLVGALSFFNININNQFEARRELIAAGLAQEGAELVSNIRDYNVLVGNSWDLNLAGCTSIDFNSLSDPIPANRHKCSNVGSSVCLDASGRYYQCVIGTSGITDFTRVIEVADSGSGDGSKKITCKVSWNSNSRVTQAVAYLYNNAF